MAVKNSSPKRFFAPGRTLRKSFIRYALQRAMANRNCTCTDMTFDSVSRRFLRIVAPANMTNDPQIGRLPRRVASRSSIRLLIASEHPIIRTALGTMLKGIPGFEVVGETDLFHIAKTARERSPNVFLLELTEAGLRGLRAVAALVRAAPSAAVVILTSNENPSYIRIHACHWG